MHRSMKKLYFISTVISLVLFAGCMVDDVDYRTSASGSYNDPITIIGRITRFDEYDVTTRAVKDENEAKLTSMAMAIFPVNEAGTALAGDCVYWQYTDNQAELLFTVDRGGDYTYNARYAIYVFTNVDMSGLGIGSTLDAMMAKFHSVEDINIPENGFPMMGSLGDTFSTTFDKDNQIFILSPTENGTLVAPKIGTTTENLQTQTLLTIPMKAMYAKVNFTIEVKPDQTIEGNFSPQFTLTSYTVNNVPSTVDFSNGTNSDAEVLAEKFSCVAAGNAVASGANKIEFSFYLPERLLTPQYTAVNYPDYPFVKDSYPKQIDADQNGYRDEDEKLFQRFKGLLLKEGQKATNIVLSGTFRDHQNHYWDVEYTIHLGANNTDDFNIIRNAEYNNFVTICGIQASSDMSDNTTPGEEAVSIDHRVNVNRSQPGIITLRREVLLDSHFEVRPLRVRKNDIENVGNINAVKVEVVNPGTTKWMRLERSGGKGTSYEYVKNKNGVSIYITDEGPSKGKRRYFTYDLCTGTEATNSPLTNSTEVILPLTDEGDCCWIYVDECTEVGDDVRAGIVRVTYGNLTGNTFTATKDSAFPVVNYIINQRKLFQVTYDDPETTAVENRTYNIEYEEEYLHNFDADDAYGQTDYEGMQWGLDGIQLSYDNDALYFESSVDLITWIINAIKSSAGVNPQYDFYIPKHDTSVSSQATKRDFRGYVFCNEIITTINGGQTDSDGNAYDTDINNNIDILQLDEQPKSAIEYCYNKNKRNAEGHVVWQKTDGSYDQTQLNWYLPAIDEIEDIVMSKYGSGLMTYARFLEFQEKFYWSSQPSYVQNYAHYHVSLDRWGILMGDYDGNYYYDDIKYARSTSVSWNNSTQKFEYERSGVNSDYNALVIEGSVFGGYSSRLITTGSYKNHSLGIIDRQLGNKPRTDYARVRCVRKSEHTNTNAN